MNLRRGSTSSPISVEKIRSASTASLDLHLQQGSLFRIHCCFPELARVHLTEPLVALDIQALARLTDDLRNDLAQRRGLHRLFAVDEDERRVTEGTELRRHAPQLGELWRGAELVVDDRFLEHRRSYVCGRGS